MKLIAFINGKEVAVDIVKKDGKYDLTIEGKSFSVDAIWPGVQSLSLLVKEKSFEVGVEKSGNSYTVFFFNDTIQLDIYEARKFKAAQLTSKAGPAGPLKVVAPMPGKIVRLSVAEKSRVQQGDSLLIMEAMKMQNELKAPKSGTVMQVHVKEGEPVSSLQLLMVLE